MPPSPKSLKSFFSRKPASGIKLKPMITRQAGPTVKEASLRSTLAKGKKLGGVPISARPTGVPKRPPPVRPTSPKPPPVRPASPKRSPGALSAAEKSHSFPKGGKAIPIYVGGGTKPTGTGLSAGFPKAPMGTRHSISDAVEAKIHPSLRVPGAPGSFGTASTSLQAGRSATARLKNLEEMHRDSARNWSHLPPNIRAQNERLLQREIADAKREVAKMMGPSVGRHTQHVDPKGLKYLSQQSTRPTVRAFVGDARTGGYRDVPARSRPDLRPQQWVGGPSQHSRKVTQWGRSEIPSERERLTKLTPANRASGFADRASRNAEHGYYNHERLGADGKPVTQRQLADRHKTAAQLHGEAEAAQRHAGDNTRAEYHKRQKEQHTSRAKSQLKQHEQRTSRTGKLTHGEVVGDYEHEGDTEHLANEYRDHGALDVTEHNTGYVSERDPGEGSISFKLPKGVSRDDFDKVVEAGYHAQHSGTPYGNDPKGIIKALHEDAKRAVRMGNGREAKRLADKAIQTGKKMEEARRRAEQVAQNKKILRK